MILLLFKKFINFFKNNLVALGAAMIVGMLIWYIIVRKRMSKTSSTEIITDRSN